MIKRLFNLCERHHEQWGVALFVLPVMTVGVSAVGLVELLAQAFQL